MITKKQGTIIKKLSQLIYREIELENLLWDFAESISKPREDIADHAIDYRTFQPISNNVYDIITETLPDLDFSCGPAEMFEGCKSALDVEKVIVSCILWDTRKEEENLTMTCTREEYLSERK